EKMDVVQILRDAGATDESVTEKNGHAVDEKSEPVAVVMKYVDAMQHEDAAGLQALTTFRIDSASVKSWKESHPPQVRLLSGFANGGAATVTVRGKLPSGLYETWTYQLVHADPAWKVASERWESRLDSTQP
ncbi:MAG TPA: hypothetical protein VI391_10195, partial [Thermoanaerobaculia bacterium]